jgi:hypothetical protein
METHGVTQSVISAELPPSIYNPPPKANVFTARLLGALPFIGLSLAYGATQLAAWIKVPILFPYDFVVSVILVKVGTNVIGIVSWNTKRGS